MGITSTKLNTLDSSDIINYVPKTNNYVESSKLSTILNQYEVAGNYAPAANYITPDQLNQYQPTGNYAPAANYATVDDLKKYQKNADYVFKSELLNYAPSGNYATKSDLALYQPVGNYQPADSYTTHSDLQQYLPMSTLVTSASNVTTENKNYINAKVNKYFGPDSPYITEANLMQNYQIKGNYAPAANYLKHDEFIQNYNNLNNIYQQNPNGDSYVSRVSYSNAQLPLAKSNQLNSYLPKLSGDSYLTQTEFANISTSSQLNQFAQKEDLSAYQPAGNYALAGNYIDSGILHYFMTYDDLNTDMAILVPSLTTTFTGPHGPNGTVGATGQPGANGNPGQKGPKGPKGNTGIPGLPGLNGMDGIPGPKGVMGPKGQTGPIGPQGDMAPNPNVDSLIMGVANTPSAVNPYQYNILSTNENNALTINNGGVYPNGTGQNQNMFWNTNINGNVTYNGDVYVENLVSIDNTPLNSDLLGKIKSIAAPLSP